MRASETTDPLEESRLGDIELPDLAVTRFVEDSSVIGSPTSWRGMPSMRPVKRLTSDLERNV
jgi:hypothetical protein